jgi:hypothetical protein
MTSSNNHQLLLLCCLLLQKAQTEEMEKKNLHLRLKTTIANIFATP